MRDTQARIKENRALTIRYHLLTLCAQFQYLGIELVSVSDGLNTKKEHLKLSLQMRGIINELYLDDLKKKTHRG